MCEVSCETPECQRETRNLGLTHQGFAVFQPEASTAETTCSMQEVSVIDLVSQAAALHTKTSFNL